MEKGKAIALLSGGLDSILAVKIIVDQGIRVTAVNMSTPFCTCDAQGKCYSDVAADSFGIPLRRVWGGEDYLRIVRNPSHGYGKNMNPCIDCRVYLFMRAKEIMGQEKADFIFTGEVLGERPMSQRREAMNLIEKESGLKGKVLRPLSAKLLKPTQAEEKGIVDRSKLLDIQGRSRKPQLALAKRYRIEEFPTPAGGCLLTDETFSLKLRESFDRGEHSLRQVGFLKLGRHFRLPSGAKVIAGRDQFENQALMELSQPGELKLTAHEHKSTYLLLLGQPDEDDVIMAAGICARYSDGNKCPSLPVRIWQDYSSQFRIVQTSPIDPPLLESLRIGG